MTVRLGVVPQLLCPTAASGLLMASSLEMRATAFWSRPVVAVPLKA